MSIPREYGVLFAGLCAGVGGLIFAGLCAWREWRVIDARRLRERLAREALAVAPQAPPFDTIGPAAGAELVFDTASEAEAGGVDHVAGVWARSGDAVYHSASPGLDPPV